MLDTKVAILIKNLALIFDKMAIPVLAPYELTPSQFKVIKYLLRHRGEDIRQREIEVAYSMTNPTVTGILNNLEKNGWAMRVENENDARSKLVRLTEKSLSQERELYAVGERLEHEFTAVLSEAEYEELKALLQKLFHSLT